MYFHICIEGRQKIECRFSLKPASEGNFMPIYYCREGIEYSDEKTSKRILLIEKTLQERNYSPHRLEVKHSSYFADPALYHQYLTGLLQIASYIAASKVTYKPVL